MEQETIEQLIRTLEWYEKVATHMGNCVLDKDTTKACLNAIKGLNEDNKKLAELCAEKTIIVVELGKQVERLTEENEQLRKAFSRYEEYTGMNLLKAETVRKMQERLKEAFDHRGLFGFDIILKKIDQIAKEMQGDGNT